MESKVSSVGSSPVPPSVASGLSYGTDSASTGESPYSSSELFSSVFPPASTVMGRDSSRWDIFWPTRKHDDSVAGAGQACHAKHNATKDGISQESAGDKDGISFGSNFIDKDADSSYRKEHMDRCFLGSSLYYGGQDVFTHPPASHTYRPTNKYKKDVEDGSGSSRGDWWEGSLYY